MMHQTDVFARNSTREMRQRAWLHACTSTFTHYRKLFAAAAAAFNILSSFTSAIKSINLRSPGIDSQPGGPVRQPYLSYRPTRAGIIKEAMGARNRGGRGFSYRPAGLHRLAESFLGIDSGAPYTFKNTSSG